MIALKEVRDGSIVIVRPSFGSGQPVRVIVTEVESDIKNGRPGICYGDNWAYLSQVDKVVQY